MDLFKLYMNMFLFFKTFCYSAFWSHLITTFLNYMSEHFTQYINPNTDEMFGHLYY